MLQPMHVESSNNATQADTQALYPAASRCLGLRHLWAVFGLKGQRVVFGRAASMSVS